MSANFFVTIAALTRQALEKRVFCPIQGLKSYL
jgi:hypothetical protein